MKSKIHRIYLDWVNNFLTISAIASYYDLPEDRMQRVINIGREIHERKVKAYKDGSDSKSIGA